MFTQKVKTARKIKSSWADLKALSQFISSNQQEREQVMLVPTIELVSSETQPPTHIAALALDHISGCAVQFSQPENSWGFARFAKNQRKYFFIELPQRSDRSKFLPLLKA